MVIRIAIQYEWFHPDFLYRKYQYMSGALVAFGNSFQYSRTLWVLEDLFRTFFGRVCWYVVSNRCEGSVLSASGIQIGRFCKALLWTSVACLLRDDHWSFSYSARTRFYLLNVLLYTKFQCATPRTYMWWVESTNKPFNARVDAKRWGVCLHTQSAKIVHMRSPLSQHANYAWHTMNRFRLAEL